MGGRERERRGTEDGREAGVGGRSREERERDGFSIHDSRVILTVGHTLILDLQVLVRPRARVWEDVRTRDHDALGPVVASGGRKSKEI